MKLVPVTKLDKRNKTREIVRKAPKLAFYAQDWNTMMIQYYH